MQNPTASFMVRLTIERTCLLALFLFMVAISPLLARDEARAARITFSDYPVGTTITDQYRGVGVVFSGEPGLPIISPPWWHEPAQDEPALMGAPKAFPAWGSDSLIVSFVDPTDGTPAEAQNVGLYYYWWTRLGSPPVTITYYDIRGGIISQADLGEDANPHIPPTLHQFVITTQTASGGNYFHIDDLNFHTVPPPPSLVDPGPSTDPCRESMAGQPINVPTGDVWISRKDYAVPGLAGGLSLSRTWNSLWNQSNPPCAAGMFGRGWTSDFEERVQVFNSTHILYWRGSGNTWICEAPGGCPSCAYTVMSPPHQHASLHYHSATTHYTLSFANGTTKVFSNAGRVVAVRDRHGNHTTVS